MAVVRQIPRSGRLLRMVAGSYAMAPSDVSARRHRIRGIVSLRICLCNYFGNYSPLAGLNLLNQIYFSPIFFPKPLFLSLNKK